MPVSMEHRLRVLAHQERQLKVKVMTAKKVPSPIDIYVGKRIRQARMSARLSQENLADALGLTFQQVQKYEKGTNRIAPSRLIMVASNVRRPVAWFFPAADSSIPLDQSDAAMDLACTREGAALADAFNRIKEPALRGAILALAQQAANGAAVKGD